MVNTGKLGMGCGADVSWPGLILLVLTMIVSNISDLLGGSPCTRILISDILSILLLPVLTRVTMMQGQDFHC